MANEKIEVARYTCRKVASPITIDGNLDKDVWKSAQKSARFVDMVNGTPAFFDTRIASLWDDEYLYLAYFIEEPDVRASFTERDSLIWFDNDIELFIDGEDCYYELEINAFNTVYEVFFIYQDALKKGSRFDTGEYDLQTRDVDVLCGFQDASRYRKSARGKRWAFMDWDFPGLKSAVQVQGKINDSGSLDKGWTVEIALPWKGIQKLYGTRTFPPKKGDILRAAFFRFEALRVNGKTVNESQGWALNQHGVYDSHIPEVFSCLEFSD
jgi:hypothetical protein